MARGMSDTLLQAQVRLASEIELDQYCYYVAGTVGEMLTALFAADRNGALEAARPWLDRHAVDFGLGLQMTNVIKDVTEDFARGVVYLPQSVLQVTGADIETLFSNPHGEAAKAVVGRITGRALGCLDAAYAYTLAVPPDQRDIRVFCALPLVLALRTLGRAISELSSFESGRAPKVSRSEVEDLHAGVEACASNDVLLGGLIRRERSTVLRALAQLTPNGWPRLAYVATGSNLGDRHGNLDRARELLAQVPGVRVLREAGRIETEPVECSEGSGAFVNSAIEVSTILDSAELLGALLETERTMGRIRTDCLNEPRLIDLDLVLVGDTTSGWNDGRAGAESQGPVVPHPRMHLRPFVLGPLCELAPEMVHPIFNKPIVAIHEDSR
jgi:2-amino-4-hydroxy-6-hydroxymethyldihydropteridine diphosphokinase